MPINLAQLTSATITARELSNLILVIPNKPIGIQAQVRDNTKPTDSESSLFLPPDEAFFFDVEGDQSYMMNSDITDHYVEDNTAIQDQISLKPEEYTVNGYVAEMNDIVPKALAPLQIAADKLILVSAYVPELSITAIVLYNEAKFAYDTASALVNNAVQAWQSFSGTAINQTRQQLAFIKFYGYWRERRLFTIQTPWASFRDMVIKTIKATQNADDRTITDFEITFKQMRFSSTLILPAGSTLGQFQALRAATQSSALIDYGPQTPVPVLGTMQDFLNGLR